MQEFIMTFSVTGIRNSDLNPFNVPRSLSSYVTGECTPDGACSFSFSGEFANVGREKDEFWKSLTPSEIKTLKDLIYYQFNNEFVVNALKSRIFSKSNEYLNQVAEKMGSSEKFSVTNFYPVDRDALISDLYLMQIDPVENHISIGQECAAVLNGWTDDISLQSVLGVMAHELGHRILKHFERHIAFGLELNGISVESLDDITTMLKSNCKEFPQKESVKRICQYLNNYYEKFSKRFDPTEIVIQKKPEFYRDQEREADLLTMRDPYLARGVRDQIVRLIENCEKNPKFKPFCFVYNIHTSTHPSAISRIQYLTRALCGEYPEENRDICPNAGLRYQGNSTCPAVDLSYKY